MGKVAQRIADETYNALCASLADLEIRADRDREKKRHLRSQIEALNSMVPVMHRIESEVREEHQTGFRTTEKSCLTE